MYGFLYKVGSVNLRPYKITFSTFFMSFFVLMVQRYCYVSA